MSTKYLMTLAVNENSIQSIDDLRSADSAVHFWLHTCTQDTHSHHLRILYSM